MAKPKKKPATPGSVSIASLEPEVPQDINRKFYKNKTVICEVINGIVLRSNKSDLIGKNEEELLELKFKWDNVTDKALVFIPHIDKIIGTQFRDWKLLK